MQNFKERTKSLNKRKSLIDCWKSNNICSTYISHFNFMFFLSRHRLVSFHNEHLYILLLTIRFKSEWHINVIVSFNNNFELNKRKQNKLNRLIGKDEGKLLKTRMLNKGTVYIYNNNNNFGSFLNDAIWSICKKKQKCYIVEKAVIERKSEYEIVIF